MRNSRIIVNSIVWVVLCAFIIQNIGWALQFDSYKDLSKDQYLSPQSEFLIPDSLLNTKGFLVMGVLLTLIKNYHGNVDIELLNKWIKETRFNQGGLSDVIAIPFNKDSQDTEQSIVFLGDDFKIVFYPAVYTQQGELIPGSSLRVQITRTEAQSKMPKLLPAPKVEYKPLSKRLGIYIRNEVKEFLNKYPFLKGFIRKIKSYVKTPDPEREKKWILGQLDRYGTAPIKEKAEIIADFNERDVWDRFEVIFRYAEDEELTLRLIDYLYIILTDRDIDDFTKNKVLNTFLKYLDDLHPKVLNSISTYLVNLYKDSYTRENPHLPREVCHRVSEELDKFITKRVPQLLKTTYSKEGFKEERLALYEILGVIYSKVHTLSVYRLDKMFKDEAEIPLDVIISILDRLVLISQEITNEQVRSQITGKVKFLLQRRIREFQRYLPEEGSKDDVINVLKETADLVVVLDAAKNLFRIAMEKRKVLPRMYRSVVRRLVSIYGTIIDEGSKELMRERTNDLMMAYSPELIDREQVQPFLDVTFDIANYKDQALKQMIQIFSEVNTREELLTMLRQLVLVSVSRPNNISIKRTIFAVLVARLGPEHLGRKLYYLMRGEDTLFQKGVRAIVRDAREALGTLPPSVSVEDIFTGIKRQVNGGLNLSVIDFDKLEKCYIAKDIATDKLKQSEAMERNEFQKFLDGTKPGRDVLISQNKIEQRIGSIRKIREDVSRAGTELEKFSMLSSGLLGLMKNAVHRINNETLITDIIFQTEREELISVYEKPVIYGELNPLQRGWEENVRAELLKVLRDKDITKVSEILLKLATVILNYDANTTALRNGKFYNFNDLIEYLVQWGRDIAVEDMIKLLYFEMRLAQILYSDEYPIVRTKYIGGNFHIKKTLEALRQKSLAEIKEEMDRGKQDLKTVLIAGKRNIICGIPVMIDKKDKGALLIGEKDFLKEPILSDIDKAVIGDLTPDERKFISSLAIAISEPNKTSIEELNKQRQGLIEKDKSRAGFLQSSTELRAEKLFLELLKVLSDNKELAEYQGHKYARIILRQNYDLVIVGFGPAGASAAITARKRMPNAKILVIEVQPRGHRKECAGILEERAIWGIAELLGPEKFREFKEKHLVATTYVRTFAPDGSQTESFSKRHVADRGILNVFLRNRAEELGGIDFLDEHNVEDIKGFNPSEEIYDHFAGISIASKTDKQISLNVKAKFVLMGTGYKGENLYKKIGMEREQTNIGAAKVAYIPTDERFVEKYFGRKIKGREGRDEVEYAMEIHWFTEDPKEEGPTHYGWILPKREGNNWYLDVGVGGFGKGGISTELLHKFIASLQNRITIDKEYQETMKKAGLKGFGGGGIVRFKSMPTLDKEHIVVIGSGGGIEHPFADDGIGISILSGMRAAEKIGNAIRTDEEKVSGYTEEMHGIVADQEKYGLPVQQLFLKNPKLVSYLVKNADKDFLTQVVFTKLLSAEFNPDPNFRSRHFQEMVILFTSLAITSPRFLWQFVKAFFKIPLTIFKLAGLVMVNIRPLIESLNVLYIKKYTGFKEDEALDLIKTAVILMPYNARKEKVIIYILNPDTPDERYECSSKEALEIIISHIRENYSVYFANGYFTIKVDKGEERHFTKEPVLRIARPRLVPQPKDTRKTVLITGATGQVGSHIAYYFANRGYRVIATDRPKKVKYKFDHPNIETELLDITDFDAYVDLLNREHVDLIVNSAAVIHGSLKEQLKINAYAAQTIATEAANRKIPFFQISSGSVYGKGNLEDVAEDSQTMPDSPYNVSKLLGEQLVKEISDNNLGSPIVILRLPVVYGRARKIQGFNRLLWAIRNRLMPFYLTTPPERGVRHSYVDARVTVPASIEFLFNYQEKDKVYGEIFNVANPEPVPYIDLIKRIKEEMGRAMPLNLFLSYYIVRPIIFVGVNLIRFINAFLPKNWEITIDFELNYINSLYYNFTVSTKKLEDLGFRPGAPTFFKELPDLVDHFRDAIKSVGQHDFQAKVKDVDAGASVKEFSNVISVSPKRDLVLGEEFAKFCENLNLKPGDVEKVLRLAFSLRSGDIKGEIQELRFRLSSSHTHLFGDHVMNRIVTLNDKALKNLPESSRLLAVAVGLTHEILGHEQGTHDEAILTEKDANMTQILALLLNLSTTEYIGYLEGVLVKEESPYLIKLSGTEHKIEQIPFSLLNKMPVIEGLVYHYVLFAEHILAVNGARIEPHMDVKAAVLAKLKANLKLDLTAEEEGYLTGLIELLWGNKDILQSIVSARMQSFKRVEPPTEDAEKSIREAIADIKTNVELGYSKDSPGLLIFDLDKLLEDRSYVALLREIIDIGGNYKIIVVNHDRTKSINKRVVDKELRMLIQRVIKVDAFKLKQYTGTDLGNAIVREAIKEARHELGDAEIPKKNIVLAIQPANIYLYPEDILKGLTLLILSSTKMVLTEKQIEALKAIYPEITSHLKNGKELLLLQEVYYNMELLQQIRQAREEIKKQA